MVTVVVAAPRVAPPVGSESVTAKFSSSSSIASSSMVMLKVLGSVSPAFQLSVPLVAL